MDHNAGRRPSVPRRSALLDELTARELEVRGLIARGLAKLHLRDRAQAVVFAYEHGVVVPGA